MSAVSPFVNRFWQLVEHPKDHFACSLCTKGSATYFYDAHTPFTSTLGLEHACIRDLLGKSREVKTERESLVCIAPPRQLPCPPSSTRSQLSRLGSGSKDKAKGTTPDRSSLARHREAARPIGHAWLGETGIAAKALLQEVDIAYMLPLGHCHGGHRQPPSRDDLKESAWRTTLQCGTVLEMLVLMTRGSHFNCGCPLAPCMVRVPRHTRAHLQSEVAVGVMTQQ